MVDSPRLVLYPLQGLQLWLSERAGQQLLIFPGGHGPGAGPGDPAQQGFGLGQAQQGSWEEANGWSGTHESNGWARNSAEPSSWSQSSHFSNNWQTGQPSASTTYHGTNKAGTTTKTFYQGPHSVYHGNKRTYFSPEQGVWCPGTSTSTTSATSSLNRHLAPAGPGGCTCNCRFGPRHNQQEVIKIACNVPSSPTSRQPAPSQAPTICNLPHQRQAANAWRMISPILNLYDYTAGKFLISTWSGHAHGVAKVRSGQCPMEVPRHQGGR